VSGPSVHVALKGASFEQLDADVRRFHRTQGRMEFLGRVQTLPPASTPARLLAEDGLSVTGLETLLMVDGPRSWQDMAAILRILRTLGGPWRLAWLAWLVPAPLRDGLYRWIARHRYSIFGRADQCLRPPAGSPARFLD
jgi:predicted DCC family thiol-disulfide oxidoreductase YuxK